MSRISDYLLNSASFLPHGYCLLWRPDLVAMYVASDLLIAVAYFSIPLALLTFVRQRAHLQFKWIFWMFACFITACGLTHVGDLMTLCRPYYGMQALIKVACAIISVGTAVAIWPLIPHSVALPSPSQLKIANRRLQADIAQRIEAQRALGRALREPELRVSELAEANLQLKHEVAERARAETELRRAFSLLDQRVNNTPLAVIEWEQDHASGAPPRVRRWSGRAQAMFGWTEAEVLNRSIYEFGLIYESDAHRADDSGRDLVKGRKRHNSVSLRCYTRDRHIYHC